MSTDYTEERAKNGEVMYIIIDEQTVNVFHAMKCQNIKLIFSFNWGYNLTMGVQSYHADTIHPCPAFGNYIM